MTDESDNTSAPEVIATIRAELGRKPAIQSSVANTESTTYSLSLRGQYDAHQPQGVLTDDEMGALAVGNVKRGATVGSTLNNIASIEKRMDWINGELEPVEYDRRTGDPIYRREAPAREQLRIELESLKQDHAVENLSLVVARQYAAEQQQALAAEVEIEAATEEFVNGDSELREMVQQEVKRQKAAHFAAWIIGKSFPSR